MKASLVAGPPTYAGVMLPSQATTSGNAVDFSVPGWASHIRVSIAGLSTNGSTDVPLVQLGDAGGVETSGYLASVENGSGSAANSTTGFAIVAAVGAASVMHGTVMLTRHSADGAQWTAIGNIGFSNGADVHNMAGSKTLSAPLTTVRFTLSGTPADAFDAGSVTVHYW